MPSHIYLPALVMALSLACIDKASDPDEDDGNGDVTVDADGDGFTARNDCDDENADINPDADEVCGDAIDNDCDDEIDEDDATDAETWYADSDGDGYGDAESTTTACEAPSGYTADSSDCDDGDDTQYPEADELCNGEDDDCDTEVDEAGALDESTWYADSDGDGFGDESIPTTSCDVPSGYTDDSSDCDDTRAHIYPGADEVCDGMDTDCDATTEEVGLVSLQDSSGGFWDVSVEFEGTTSVPATPTLDEEDGTYWFCEGVHSINANVEASVTLSSMNGDPTSTLLYGAETASIVTIDQDGVDIRIEDLAMMSGQGSGDLDLDSSEFTGAGGAIFCRGQSDIELDGVILSNNSGMVGGAIASQGCDLDLVSSVIKENDAAIGGGLMLIDADISMSYSDINDNVGTTVSGAIYHSALQADVDFEMTESLIYDNVSVGAFSGSAVALVSSEDHSIDGTCYGSDGTDAGLLSNESSSYGALVLSDGGGGISFDSMSCDWGTEADGDENDVADIWINTEDGDYEYRIGNDYDISCEDGRCGTQTVSTLGGSSYDYTGATKARGNIFIAETTETLDEFSVWVNPQESCELDFYVLSEDGPSGTWSIEYSSSDYVSAGYAWVSSGTIGMAVDAGSTYALVYGWDCDLNYFLDVSGSSTLDGGFGTSTGNWLDSAFYGSYSGYVSDESSSSSNRYYMMITTSK
jgi:hypothetical protein